MKTGELERLYSELMRLRDAERRKYELEKQLGWKYHLGKADAYTRAAELVKALLEDDDEG